jgi:hypothetical protein
MEGIAAPEQSSKLAALQFLAVRAESLVPSLFDALRATQITSVVLTLNLVLIALTMIALFYTAYNRALRAAATGQADGQKSTSYWAIRVWLAVTMLIPAPDFSLAQKFVFFIANSSSGFADRLAVAAGDPRNTMRINLRFAGNQTSPDGTPGAATAQPLISPESGRIVAAILESQWCQVWLTKTIAEPNSTLEIPPPVETVSWDGTSKIVFGVAQKYNQNGRIPSDVCGSLSLPLPIEAKAEAAQAGTVANFASRFQNISQLPRAILQAHRAAIVSTLNRGAAVAAMYPTTPGSPHLLDETFNATRQKIRDQAVALASEYHKIVVAAGGGTTTRPGSFSTAGSADKLDPRWGWIRFGFDIHKRSQNVVEGVNSLTWTPSVTSPSFSGITPPVRTTNYGVFAEELRAAGLTKTFSPPASDSGSSGGKSFDISTIVDFNKISAALQSLDDPHADVFEVGAVVGTVFQQVASAGLVAYGVVSYFAPGIGSFVSMFLGTMMAGGMALAVGLPLAPLVGWLFLILGWLASVIYLVFSVTFSSIALVRDESDSLWSGALGKIIARLTVLLFMPTLLVVGMIVFQFLLQTGWYFASSAIAGVAKSALTGSVIAIALGGIIAAFFLFAIMTSIVYFAVSKIGALQSAAADYLDERVSASAGTGERISGGEHIKSSGALPSLGKAAAPSSPPTAPGAPAQSPANFVSQSVPGR